jgi:hypothetical protein
MRVAEAARLVGLPPGSTPEAIVAEARRLKAAADAAYTVSGTEATLARDRTALAAVEGAFASPWADEVDVEGALVHTDALTRLAARGVTDPSPEEYAREVAAAVEPATTNPSLSAGQGEPLLRIHPNPNTHHGALQVLREQHVLDDSQTGVATQQEYDQAVAEHERRMRR